MVSVDVTRTQEIDVENRHSVIYLGTPRRQFGGAKKEEALGSIKEVEQYMGSDLEGHSSIILDFTEVEL